MCVHGVSNVNFPENFTQIINECKHLKPGWTKVFEQRDLSRYVVEKGW